MRMSERTGIRAAAYGRTKMALLFTMLVLSLSLGVSFKASAAEKPKLNKSKLTLTVGQKKTLKVKNAGRKKVKWRSTNKRIATVSAKGVVKAKAKGRVVITAKVKGRTLRCKVTVKKKAAENKQTVKVDQDTVKFTGVSGDAVEAASTVISDKTNIQPSTPKANYSYEVYVLGRQPHMIYSDETYPIYVRTDNPNVKTFDLKFDGDMSYSPNMRCDDVEYIDTETQRVSGGYLLMYTFKSVGTHSLSLVEYQDRAGSSVDALACHTESGRQVTSKSIQLTVTDTEKAWSEWADASVRAHTSPSMNSMEKMKSVCEYLTSPQAGFRYPDNMDGKVLRLAGGSFGPGFVTKQWNSYITPSVLCLIAEKISGFSDIHNCYGDYPYGSSQWNMLHDSCRVTDGDETKYFSICPMASTGAVSSVQPYNVSETTQGWRIM